MPIKRAFNCLVLFLISALSMIVQAQERIELADGSVLNVFVTEAESSEDANPLVILMGGGPGNASISRDTAQWLGSGFAARGWHVAVPISPNNRSFRGAVNNEKIELLIAELQLRETIRSDKVLLAGVSNGGMSALEIASRNPENYLGVAAVPALFTAGNTGSELEGFKIYLRIGGQDQLGWAERFDETVSNLNEAGAQLDAEILDGAPHMFRMDWSTLGPWLENL
ncbi:MAG: hypothetical protein AB8B95_08925 [Pseudohongiellaceae bacterium]